MKAKDSIESSTWGRRGFLKTLGMGAAATALPRSLRAGTTSAAATKRLPNIILILTDDQGYGDLSCHGNPIARTPTLDRLHAESIRLTNFHVDPTCSPTRAALMTGRYSHRAGVWHTIIGRNFLSRDEVTMADVLKNSGYRTGLFGKWHLGCNYPFRPIDRGFDEWVGHGDGGTGTVSDYWGNDWMNDTYYRNGKWEKFRGFGNEIFFDEAMKFIESGKDQPFFVYLTPNLVHTPLHLPADWPKPYLDKGISPQEAYFYAAVERIDYDLGRLRRFLQRQGLAENTLLIFSTDNGGTGGCRLDGQEFPVGGWNAGMRGKKGSIYDGGHRTPCFIHWPAGGLQGGRDIHRLTAHIDLLPTLIQLCGLKQPDGVEFDGMSLAPLLRDASGKWPDRILLVESQRILVPEKWRKWTVMTDRWRLVNGKELYGIQADPGQKRDVAADHPQAVRTLREFYEALWPGLSHRDNDFSRTVIGSDRQAVIWLAAIDWVPTRGGAPVYQDSILAGIRSNGYWPVEIARDGEYELALRRWPAEVDRPITAPLPARMESDVTAPGGRPVTMAAGKAIPAVKARLAIADTDQTQAVAADARASTFKVRLKAGPASLQTWFLDDKGEELCGAYYVYARRLTA